MTASRTDRPALVAEAAALLLERNDAGDRAGIDRKIEDWRARSAAHAEVWAAAERLWRATGGDSPAPVFATPRRGVSRRILVPAGVCAALAVVAGGAVLLGQAEPGQVRTGTGEVRQVALMDGSQMVLDAGAAVVPVEGQGRGARLTRGRVFFAVAHDRSRPFQVTADAVDVEVTGTAFSVARTANTVTVELAEGSVVVRVEGQGGERVEALTPGERLTVDATGAVRRSAVSPAAIGAWRFGELAVEDATLQQVVEALRPHFRGVILDPPAALAGQRVTGVFSLKDPETALEGAVTPFNARVERLSPWGLRIVAEK